MELSTKAQTVIDKEAQPLADCYTGLPSFELEPPSTQTRPLKLVLSLRAHQHIAQLSRTHEITKNSIVEACIQHALDDPKFLAQ